MTTLFISDLHLCAQRPVVVQMFLDFLRGRAARADALYILGDLFEYWIGDEAMQQTDYAAVIAGLRGVTDHGVPVHVMHGNRDFLLGEQFAEATGCRLLADPACIDLYGERVLLMHGDTLCTDDVAYQDFRRMVRDPQWIAGFLGKDLAERNAIVRNLRETSKAAMAEKTAEIMDVNPETVQEVMRGHCIYHMIHGHTHRPAQHDLKIDGRPARRTVLGDWYEHGSVLACVPGGCVLESLRQG
jgi:UDP-2,3-diacylglucosamine hydrolase